MNQSFRDLSALVPVDGLGFLAFPHFFPVSFFFTPNPLRLHWGVYRRKRTLASVLRTPPRALTLLCALTLLHTYILMLLGYGTYL